MLLYSLLHLTGYDLTIEDLEQFRQWGSRTPGHPERRCAPGVEVSTGPLGQGPATAWAWRSPSGCSPRSSTGPAAQVVDHHTYAICSDGDLMEGMARRRRRSPGTSGSAS